MAHALPNHNGPCKNIHGHSYTLSVTVIGFPVEDKTRPDHGMIMDFGDLKKIVNTNVVNVFDHALVLNKNTEKTLKTELAKNFEKLFWVDYHPTSENLIVDFVNRIQPQLPGDVNLYSLTLRETATSLAEWQASDNV